MLSEEQIAQGREAFDHITHNMVQLDQDGINVSVSRDALEAVLSIAAPVLYPEACPAQDHAPTADAAGALCAPLPPIKPLRPSAEVRPIDIVEEVYWMFTQARETGRTEIISKLGAHFEARVLASWERYGDGIAENHNHGSS